MENEMLNYLVENGMINLLEMQEKMELTRREKILAKHAYSIWEGVDGLWHTYLPDSDKGRIPRKRKTKEEIESVIVEYYTNKDKIENRKTKAEERIKFQFKANFERWKETQTTYGIVNNTLLKYESDYLRFFEGTEFETMDIREITEEHITSFIIGHIRTKKLTEKTSKALWGYVSGVFRSACVNRLLDKNPCLYVDTRRFNRFYCKTAKRTAPRTFTDLEVERIIELMFSDYLKRPSYIPAYGIELAIFTGMRVGELSGLMWCDVSFEDKIIYIRRSEKYDRLAKEYYVDITKNGKERQFPLTDDLERFFIRQKQLQEEFGFTSEYVFANERGRVHSRLFCGYLRRKCENLGIPTRGVHALRRTLNSKLRCAGMPSVIAASLLGHTEGVNDKYYTYDVSTNEYKMNCVESVSPNRNLRKNAG